MSINDLVTKLSAIQEDLIELMDKVEECADYAKLDGYDTPDYLEKSSRIEELLDEINYSIATNMEEIQSVAGVSYVL